MAIAKGSKSSVVWKEESSYGVAPAGNWNIMPLNNETLDESLGEILGDDIRPDRTRPLARGGNISAGGAITTDLVAVRSLTWFRHLLAAGAAAAGSAVTISTLAASTAYNRGDFVKNTGGLIYVCVVGGTTDAAVTGTSLSVTAGRQDVAGATSTTLTFEYAHAALTNVYEHTLTPTADFPAVGLSIEKQIKGGTTNAFFVYKGVRINSAEIRVTQDGNAKLTWNLLGKNSVPSASTAAGTPTLTSDEQIIGFNSYFHINDQAGLGLKVAKEFDLSISNGISEDVFVVNSRERIELPEGVRTVGGSVSLYFADRAEYDLFKAESSVAVRISFVHRGAWLELEMPECRFTGQGQPKISGSGPIMQTFTYSAGKLSANYDIRLKARNTVQNPLV